MKTTTGKAGLVGMDMKPRRPGKIRRNHFRKRGRQRAGWVIIVATGALTLGAFVIALAAR